MFIDLAPLKKHRDFRFLYISQIVSFLGSMITYVAVPYQMYELTKSSYMVGLLGTVQLIPVVLFGLIGGSVADRVDRRRLLLVSELLMSLGALLLALNALAGSPNVSLIFVVTALMQAANGFHRPAMEALTQKLIPPEDLPSVSALGAFRYSVGSVVGPALGGLLIAELGAAAVYFVDLATFAFALLMIWMMRATPASDEKSSMSFSHMLEGIRFGVKRPELMGTYIVDIVAMTFAFSTALYPAMANEYWGGAKAAGALFSAMSVGALVITIFSGWTGKVRRHGAAVVVAAAFWGVAMIAFGYASSLPLALGCLVLAGAADTISALFRGIIWNETIPNDMRGRMAGIEMISYMTGPLIGNARAGWVATATSNQVSIVSGGVLCVVGVLLCVVFLPKFWRYETKVTQPIDKAA